MDPHHGTLGSAQDYAMLNGEKVPGTWTFTGWDKTGDFMINAETTITGSWIFMPAEEPEPEERASCTVRCLLQDGTPLAPEIKYTGRRAGMQIRAEAKTIDGYRLISNEVITIMLEPGDNVITFCYEKIAEQEPVKEETPDDAAKDAPKDATEDAAKDAPKDAPAPASAPAPLNTEPQPDQEKPAE